MKNDVVYNVILEEDPDGGYTVHCPALPGCFSQGDTKEEAIKNIKEAILAYLESLEKDKENIPEDVETIIVPVKVHE